ncbi:hypothetical protein ARSQ2_01542 [Arsenophonus endosymbiont of Bemisia tabaci Q2]|nr:hypothetical protein ARSQ2_01542 [Arsenophonus endosymbiont of Bemisia tabaci Q2]
MKQEVEFWTLVGLLLGFMGFLFSIARLFFRLDGKTANGAF